MRKPPASVDDLMVLLEGRAVPQYCVKIIKLESSADDERCVVEIDIDRAWDELGLQGATNSEVKMELIAPIAEVPH